jgi:hypothetical protein
VDFVVDSSAPVSQAAHLPADRGTGSRVRIDLVLHATLEKSRHFATPELSALVSSVLARCLDIRAVWSVGHADLTLDTADSVRELLVFADRATLQRLRKSDHLHLAGVELLVVFDGNQFENAWGRRRLSGSLARWAWRQVTDELAYYDESKWADHERDGGVVRVRRKAVLIWRSQ